MNSVFEKQLISIASKKLPEDKEDFTVQDYAGGNVDDAYNLGLEAGSVYRARDVCVMLGLNYDCQ